ncbi:MAG: ATP-binding protein [Pseudomonadota bacterium]
MNGQDNSNCTGQSAAAELIAELARLLGAPQEKSVDWDATAYRWRRHGSNGTLESIADVHKISLDDLLGIDKQKAILDTNTRQFLKGLPCNNALLWGSRGTGKSTLIKALLNRYSEQGLRVVEVEAHDLIDLPHIVEPLRSRPERFLLFVDDLSFSADDSSYRALKAALDGSVAVAPKNVLIYATSNRRHLLPEMKKENLDTVVVHGEIHHGEAVEEKISLSERFGIWLSFQPFSQELYLHVVEHWLDKLGGMTLDESIRAHALEWALRRGNRSGRVAAQFAQDVVGQAQLD